MNFAIIENGFVVNIIVGPLPSGMDGISIGDKPVAIGDQYADGVFTREGVEIVTPAEYISQLESALAEILQEALNG
jgi:hypothetical protein